MDVSLKLMEAKLVDLVPEELTWTDNWETEMQAFTLQLPLVNDPILAFEISPHAFEISTSDFSPSPTPPPSVFFPSPCASLEHSRENLNRFPSDRD
eukprot:g49751.t1